MLKDSFFPLFLCARGRGVEVVLGQCVKNQCILTASLSMKIRKYNVESWVIFHLLHSCQTETPLPSPLSPSYTFDSQASDGLEEPCGLGEQAWGAGGHGQRAGDLNLPKNA